MIRAPLPERLRPQNLDEIVGQAELLASGQPLRVLIEAGQIPSMIFWGPPGVGKTTVARVIAEKIGADFAQLSAVASGVKEVREIIAMAENLNKVGKYLTLFIDEIHRFNKAQQDALLPAVESGILTLIGATTENPSFEVISPLISRSRVFVFHELTAEDLAKLLERALDSENGFAKKFSLENSAREKLIQLSGGDARILLNSLELAVSLAEKAQRKKISERDVLDTFGGTGRRYDRAGEDHYNHASAFIKSMRGSDPDASLYYLTRMLAGGEDPKFIARRMVIFASEDIGNAMPNALVLAVACFTAVEQIGLPECALNLAQTAIYLARAPKSRASNDALKSAQKITEQTRELQIPLHLRNPVTKLMGEVGYPPSSAAANSGGLRGGYIAPKDSGFESQTYLPEKLKGKKFYRPSGKGMEK